MLFRSPIDATLWQVEGDGWTETHEPMGRAAFARLLADKCLSHDGSGCGEGSRAKAQVEREKIKTYAAKLPDSRTVRCTVPENDENDLFDAIREQLSPEAVAAIASCLQINRTNNPEVDRQVRWFHDQLCQLLGGYEQQARLAEELGL